MTQEKLEASSQKPMPFYDQEQQIGGDILEALEAYEVKPAFWSHREQYIDTLAG